MDLMNLGKGEFESALERGLGYKVRPILLAGHSYVPGPNREAAIRLARTNALKELHLRVPLTTKSLTLVEEPIGLHVDGPNYTAFFLALEGDLTAEEIVLAREIAQREAALFEEEEDLFDDEEGIRPTLDQNELSIALGLKEGEKKKVKKKPKYEVDKRGSKFDFNKPRTVPRRFSPDVWKGKFRKTLEEQLGFRLPD
ncbi:MAG: hypothetical protein HYS32_04495 [Candidatus Woesearchaeota archaeon]|nr:MAG: hypothetical protein HYS32_04495 [Candidatus Woesearchaeota archaeon]